MTQTDLNYRHSDYLTFIPDVYHHCTLNNFDVGDNPIVVKHIKALLGGETKKGLYLYGQNGVGKTHLLVSLYRIALAKEDDIDIVKYMSFSELVKSVRVLSDKNRAKDIPGLLQIFFDAKWLFLDDITVNLDNRKTFTYSPVDILSSIVEERYQQSNLITCMTANLNPVELANQDYMNNHTLSRLLAMCDSLLLKGDDRRLKVTNA